MQWYHYVIIVCIILVVLFSIFFLYILPLICYLKTFYSKNKPINYDGDIVLPNEDVYNLYKETIIKDIKDVKKIKCEELSITSFDGLKLYGRYFEYEKGAPIEIMFHGYRGDATRDLSTGVKRAFLCKRNAILIDQRASGKSEGHTITFGVNERLDCLAWTKYISEKFGEDTKLIITGISMGAATVLMASCLNLPKNVIGVLADCPYNMPKDIIMKVVKDMKLPPKLVYPFIKRGARIFGNFDLEGASPIDAVTKTNLPIIFFHGTEDDYVPCHMSEKLFDACISKKQIVTIDGGRHGTSFLKDPKKYVDELNKFFS